jgi:segregation and condensation protein A
METPIYHLDRVVHAKEQMEDFDGPLDLILHLLSKNKMEIADIQISLILEQYLEWMEKRKKLDLEVASEFVEMASQLIFIKTRMLLSLHDEEAISEMEELIASLEERQRHETYLRIQAVSEELRRRFQTGQDYLTKEAEPLPAEKGYRYVRKPADLQKAMARVLTKETPPPEPIRAFAGIVGREPYPVTTKAKEIFRRLLDFGVTRFRNLFRDSQSRSEIVATFLAVLELCKGKQILLTGNERECTLTVTGDGQGEITETAEGGENEDDTWNEKT